MGNFSKAPSIQPETNELTRRVTSSEEVPVPAKLLRNWGSRDFPL